MDDYYPEGVCGECIFAENQRFATEFVEWGGNDSGKGDYMVNGLIDCKLKKCTCCEMDYSCDKFERENT